MPASEHIRCCVDDLGTPLPHMWSVCVGAGRANEGLRADWQAQLRRAVAKCGFRYLRFHGLFHDDMFVYHEDAAGKPVYNWQYIDALFDTMLDAGIRPFVELGFSPRDMASELETVMWWKGHGSPPKDYDRWSALVTAFTQHCLARYGADEVREWYFEVWNEPNLHPFFTGTKSQYFELYRASALAIKSVDPTLRVGGPATSNFVPDGRFDGEKEDHKMGAIALEKDPDTLEWRPVWVEEFLRWCSERQLPVDFVSTHPYPTDFALDGHGVYHGISRKREAAVEDLVRLREIVRQSAYPRAEIHCTEWSSSPSSRDHTHDFPQAAAYIVLSNLEGARYADSLSYWTFTDVFEEAGGGDTIWHGGFGLINAQGLPKPAYHAYRFLHRLGNEVIAQGPGYAVTRDAEGRLVALLYHYPDEVKGTPPMTRSAEEAYATLHQGSPKDIRLTIDGVPEGTAFSVEMVDADTAWARGAWEQLGSPEPPTREQTALLAQMSEPVPAVVRATAGGLDQQFTLKPWAVMLVKQAG